MKNRNARYFAEFEDSTAAFVSSQERLKTLEKEPNDKTKLELYALYKQVRCTALTHYAMPMALTHYAMPMALTLYAMPRALILRSLIA